MKNRTILLVEDNRDDETLTLRALRRHDIADAIEVARDGAEALDLLLGEKVRDLPCVVLLDLKLPKVDGHEVLRRLRADKRTRLLPVVIFTSSDEESDLVNSYEEGANGYVRKPVEFEHFSESLRQLGLYWLLINEPPPVRR